MTNIVIPEDVNFIIGLLREKGHEAYVVGGCVRDCLLDEEPKDWDITTSALPEEVKEIFFKTIDTGIKHGTVTVMLHGTGYEVTTYRVDGEYHDGRHPDSVSFTRCLDEDLKRRDFTINAFAYSDETGVKDLFGGLDDLRNKIIRCVGNPLERFGEDALRILRAVRFAAKLDFTIEPETYRAAEILAKNLRLVSSERIKAEIDKILTSDNPGHLALLNRMGLSEYVMPELMNADEEVLSESLKKAPKELYVRWAVLAYILEEVSGGGSSLNVMKRLKFDNRTSDRVKLFVTCSGHKLPEGKTENGSLRTELRKLIHMTGKENIFDYLSFTEALSVSFPSFENDHVLLKKEAGDILERNECTSLKDLAVNGRDIAQNTGAEGAEIGKILEELLQKVLEEPELNNRETLLDMLKKNGGENGF